MKLEDLKIYSKAMQLGEQVWEIVVTWDYFQKDTVGKQWVKSSDSIAANISEGNGRFHYKDSNKFNYIARGSLSETKTWLSKAFNRKLITDIQFETLLTEIDSLGKMLNSYIKSTGKKPTTDELKHGNKKVASQTEAGTMNGIVDT
jgi:four helix bundle protein